MPFSVPFFFTNVANIYPIAVEFDTFEGSFIHFWNFIPLRVLKIPSVNQCYQFDSKISMTVMNSEHCSYNNSSGKMNLFSFKQGLEFDPQLISY